MVLATSVLRADAQIHLELFVSGLDAPTEMVQDPTMPNVQYVVQQSGSIRVIQDGVLLNRPFLDITDVVSFDHNETGMLSMAFPPDYATSGRVYVFFNSTHGQADLVLARFQRLSDNPLIARPETRFDIEWDPGSRFLVKQSPHHNGGRMIFGPDGFLYLSVGDGNSSGDAGNIAQDVTTLLGKMLRLDVNVPDDDPKGYRIPSDNPFVDGHLPGARGEIWSVGFRNPWRFSIDDPSRGGTGAIIIGDVGQAMMEEIDYEPAGQGGRNYGWSVREGLVPYADPPPPVSVQPLTDPIWAFGRTVGACVIGGWVYRGNKLDPAYRGRYFFADYIYQRLFVFTPSIDPVTHEAAPVDASAVSDITAQAGDVGPVTSIDVDANGEIYLVRQDGKIMKLVPGAEVDSDHDGLPDFWEQRYGLNPHSGTGDDGPDGDPDHDGVTNIQEFKAGTHPTANPRFARYFAEGSNSLNFFSTTIDLANPGPADAAVLLHFLKFDGTVVDHFVDVPSMQHVTVDTTTIPGVNPADFSTVIESDQLIVAERTIVWPPAEHHGSSTETAMKAPSTKWYLAEGATHGVFDLFYLIENPNTTAANINVSYLLPAPAAPIVINYTVDPHSRRTIYVDQEPGLAATDVSAVIESTNAVPIIVERSMYFSGNNIPFLGGHDSAGVIAPSAHWFFAEGATGSFFDMFLLLANPSATQTAHVTLTYLLPDGTRVPVTHAIDPASRQTHNVQLEDPQLEGTAVSTIVESDVPVIAERSMYWPQGDWTEAHNSPGATETGTVWAVAGGEEGGPFAAQTYVLIANTSNFAGSARITVLRESGMPLTVTLPLPANSRTNVPIGMTPGFEAVANGRYGVLVESLPVDQGQQGQQAAQIVIERATYSNDSSGTLWAAGAATLGTRLH